MHHYSEGNKINPSQSKESRKGNMKRPHLGLQSDTSYPNKRTNLGGSSEREYLARVTESVLVKPLHTRRRERPQLPSSLLEAILSGTFKEGLFRHTNLHEDQILNDTMIVACADHNPHYVYMLLRCFQGVLPATVRLTVLHLLRPCTPDCPDYVRETNLVLSLLFLHGQVTPDVILLVGCKIGRKEVVRYILQGQIASRSYQRAFEIACAAGHAKIATLLLRGGGIHPEFHGNIASRLASAYGHKEVVEILLREPRVNPADSDNEALIYACSGGHLEVVKLLIGDKRVSPEAQDNLAIECASYNGHVRIVGLLLRDSRVSPSGNRACNVATKNGHYEVAELIMAAILSTKK